MGQQPPGEHTHVRVRHVRGNKQPPARSIAGSSGCVRRALWEIGRHGGHGGAALLVHWIVHLSTGSLNRQSIRLRGDLAAPRA